MVFGYLTVPVGIKQGNLPLVVVLRDGLRGRSVWGFDPLVQLLANRGYAVFQVNHCGSSGYGNEFMRKGDGETGGKVQADIEDGVRWAIAKKIADPARIAVLGAQYGGYSALHALAKSPGLYKCGVAIAPIADWKVFIKDYLMPDSGIAYRLRPASEEMLIDPTMNAEALEGESPVGYASEIQAPVLIIDRKVYSSMSTVWTHQTQGMVGALEKAGHVPEVVTLPDSRNTGGDEKSRLAEYKAVEAFLAKHLGPETKAASVPVEASK